MGLQNTTLGVMSALGDLPGVDVILAADLGWEQQRTYQVADFYCRWFTDHDLHGEVIKTADVGQAAATEHSS